MSNKIFAFPCAGGTASNYNKWQGLIDDYFFPIEYKGHWTRYDEGQYISYDELIEDMIHYIKMNANVGDEISLFGHSMGGWVAYSVAKILAEKENFNMGVLFLSSCVPIIDLDDSFIMKDEADIKKFLSRVRQVPQKILNSDFFMENLLPAIKNDFLLIEEAKRFEPLKSGKLDMPITCFCGNHDSIILKPSGKMQRWKSYTNRLYEYYEFKGNHFYLYEKNNRESVCELINKQMELCHNE